MEFAPGVTPFVEPEELGEVDATFTDPASGALVTLSQGVLGVSFLSSMIELAEDEAIAPKVTVYGELEGNPYAPLTALTGTDVGDFVIADLPEGTTHFLQTEAVDVETVKEIAAGMRSVSP